MKINTNGWRCFVSPLFRFFVCFVFSNVQLYLISIAKPQLTSYVFLFFQLIFPLLSSLLFLLLFDLKDFSIIFRYLFHWKLFVEVAMATNYFYWLAMRRCVCVWFGFRFHGYRFEKCDKNNEKSNNNNSREQKWDREKSAHLIDCRQRFDAFLLWILLNRTDTIDRARCVVRHVPSIVPERIAALNCGPFHIPWSPWCRAVNLNCGVDEARNQINSINERTVVYCLSFGRWSLALVEWINFRVLLRQLCTKKNRVDRFDKKNPSAHTHTTAPIWSLDFGVSATRQKDFNHNQQATRTFEPQKFVDVSITHCGEEKRKLLTLLYHVFLSILSTFLSKTVSFSSGFRFLLILLDGKK